MNDLTLAITFDRLVLTLNLIDAATLAEAKAYTDKKVIDSGAETPDTYKGAYDSEVVASPTSGTLTLKNSTETILDGALTNSNSFTVALATPITGKVNESILIFKVGATLPAITLPVGITFPKPLVYEANKTHTIVFEQVTFNGTDYEIFGSYEIR